ncbi:MAG: 5-oxoprolinase subunit PxpA [Mycetocola sp.]
MRVDLNCDLGETVDGVQTADDAALFPLITSANIACGFHAGDAETMLSSCLLAVEHGVSVGAHVSYRDRAHFGRADLEVTPSVLIDEIVEQLEALAAAAEKAGTGIRYVKPHGALYNRIARDDRKADAVATAIARFSPGLPLMGLSGSRVAQAAAAHGLPFLREAFVDRAYQRNGSLAPRSWPGAVLHGEDEIAERAVAMVTDGTVRALDGTLLRVEVDSLCVHGDTPDAVAMAGAVRRALADAGVDLAAAV